MYGVILGRIRETIFALKKKQVLYIVSMFWYFADRASQYIYLNP